MEVFAILIAGGVIADAIMFVNGYRSYIFCAKTEQENQFAVLGFEIVKFNGMKSDEA
jgi:hypothetical protein